jgi:hypothetical protein
MHRSERAIKFSLATALFVFASGFVNFACGPIQSASAAEISRPQQEKMLLIVVPEKFRDDVAPYVEFKRQFLPTEFFTLEEVLKSSSGVDDPERLKRFFYSAWRNRSLGYVLLVGDRDVMPVRYFVTDNETPNAFNFAFFPSDLYYGDVAKDDGSFDDWNGHKGGFHAQYFGEVRGEKNKNSVINYDRIHYRCQVAVGRWPVDSVAHLKTVIDKSMKYETAMRAGQHPGRRKACFFNVQGYIDARGNLDGLARGLPKGWTAEEFFYRDQDPRYQTKLPDPAEVLDALNRGTTLAVHVGHGASRIWAAPSDRRNVGPPIGVRSIADLKNDDCLPVILSIGCSTAYFAPLGPHEPYTDIDGVEHEGTDHGEVFTSPPPPPAPYQKRHVLDSLGKALVTWSPNGAVAYIGCSAVSYRRTLTLVDGFMAGLNHGREPKIGDCWVYAVSYYYDKEHLATLKPSANWIPPTIFRQGMKYMLYGDPSLPLTPTASKFVRSSAKPRHALPAATRQ